MTASVSWEYLTLIYQITLIQNVFYRYVINACLLSLNFPHHLRALQVSLPLHRSAQVFFPSGGKQHAAIYFFLSIFIASSVVLEIVFLFL